MRDCELTSCAAAFRSLVLGRADLPWFPTSRYTRPAATARKLVLRSPYDDSQLAHWPFVVHNLSRLVRRVRAAGRVLARNNGTHAVCGRESGDLVWLRAHRCSVSFSAYLRLGMSVAR